MICHHST